jgi:hypothetical protein
LFLDNFWLTSVRMTIHFTEIFWDSIPSILFFFFFFFGWIKSFYKPNSKRLQALQWKLEQILKERIQTKQPNRLLHPAVTQRNTRQARKRKVPLPSQLFLLLASTCCLYNQTTTRASKLQPYLLTRNFVLNSNPHLQFNLATRIKLQLISCNG